MKLRISASHDGHVPLLKNNAERLDVLRSYSVLDTPVEAAFDDIARIASRICDVPIALVSLVESSRQWFKAEVGLGTRETPIDSSMCAYAILQSEMLEVPDARLDPRFANNPLVTGDVGLRFYAGAVLRTSDGHPLGTACVIDKRPRWLTDHQREALDALARQTMALLELRKALIHADAMQKHLRQLMTAAGHDLRQPLQSIMMSLEIGKLKSTDPVVIAQMTTGLAATSKLGHELDDLAIASKDIASTVDPIKGVISIKELFASLDDAWRPAAERKGLRLRMRPCPRYVVSNLSLLRSILSNLIGNAIKYTAEGHVVVGCRRLKDELQITILDTGIGIEPERHADMFGAFRKADLKSEGLGLGLTIVRSAVDKLGHKLYLESKVGHGTLVNITLPLRSNGSPSK